MSIVVEDYHKLYGDTVAVGGISFTVAPGEILGFVGPNGAGKTTTLRALAGIIAPTHGRLFIASHDVVLDPVRAKAELAYVPDEPAPFDRLTVWEHFRFTASAYRLRDWRDRGERLLDRLELVEKRNALASELSRGMKQKLAIGCGFLHNPKALLLDEPLTGLDPHGMQSMKQLIREHAAAGAAVMVSSHQLSEFEGLFTTLLILHRGRAVRFGRVVDLRNELAAEGRSETLKELFFRLTGAPAETSEVVP